MIVNDVKVIYPPNLGWLEKKLSTEEMNHLWKCIDKRKESMKDTLAGNIHESNKIIDEDDWFWKNTVGPLCQIYANQFGNIGEKIPTNQNHPYFLQKMWVNYQKQNEFHTQRELGNYLGVDNSTINKYLKGKSIPKGNIRLKLFEITGIGSISSEITPKKDSKMIESKDVKSMESNIQEILQATKTIEKGMSILQHAINENKSLKVPYKNKQLHKRFAD